MAVAAVVSDNGKHSDDDSRQRYPPAAIFAARATAVRVERPPPAAPRDSSAAPQTVNHQVVAGVGTFYLDDLVSRLSKAVARIEQKA